MTTRVKVYGTLVVVELVVLAMLFPAFWTTYYSIFG